MGLLRDRYNIWGHSPIFVQAQIGNSPLYKLATGVSVVEEYMDTAVA